MAFFIFVIMEDNNKYKFCWYDAEEKLSTKEQERVVKFLYTALGRFRDNAEEIQKAIDYALKKVPSFGGFIGILREDDDIVGATVVIATGMNGYIPSYILVYIAVDESKRGAGLGKSIIQEIIKKTNGGIALHVEPDNPAKNLYERMGFTNKYLEMRYTHTDEK